MGKKKKILAIACMPFYQEKGSSLRLYSILKILTIKYEVDLVTYSLGEDIDIENVNVYRTTKFFKPKIVVSKASFSKLILDKLIFLKAFKLLLFSSKNYEIIHCEDFEAAFVGMILKKMFRKKMIYLLHNRVTHNWEINKRRTPSLVRYLEKKVVNNSDLIIANWKMYLTSYIFKHKEIFLHYDSVDTSVTKLKLPTKKYFFYAGNFQKYQGVFDFLKIYRKSKSKIPVVLAGTPDKEITDFIKQNKLSKKVSLVGRKSVSETNYLIKNSFCCLLPRVSGVQPSMKMIHYLMWEKPIIGKNLFCNAELIKDGYNGFLYDSNFELEEVLKKVENQENLKKLEKGLKKTKEKILELVDEKRFLENYEID